MWPKYFKKRSVTKYIEAEAAINYEKSSLFKFISTSSGRVTDEEEK